MVSAARRENEELFDGVIKHHVSDSARARRLREETRSNQRTTSPFRNTLSQLLEPHFRNFSDRHLAQGIVKR